MKLVFAFGLCFQLPVLMTLAGACRACHLGRYGGQAQVRDSLCFHRGRHLHAAGSALSQLSLAIPIILLYEISIYMAKLVEKKRLKDQAQGRLAGER